MTEIVCPLCGASGAQKCIRGRYPGHKFDLENPLDAPHNARAALIRNEFEENSAGFTEAIVEMSAKLQALLFSLNTFRSLYKENKENNNG